MGPIPGDDSGAQKKKPRVCGAFFAASILVIWDNYSATFGKNILVAQVVVFTVFDFSCRPVGIELRA
jgi:hypothetical protein